MTTLIKKSNLNAKDLLQQIMWVAEWSYEDLDEEFYGQIRHSKILMREFVVKDWKGNETWLFKDYDNPLNNETTLACILKTEEIIASFPNGEESFLDQKKAVDYITLFSSIKASVDWQTSIYKEKYERYKNALDYTYNLKIEQVLLKLEKEMDWFLEDIVEYVKENSKEKEEWILELEKQREKDREVLRKKLEADESVNSVELKKYLKDFDEETKSLVKEKVQYYKDLMKARENELQQKRDSRYKMYSKTYAETIATSSEGYREMARKFKMIKMVKEYFENRSNDLSQFIITMNSIHKNTVNFL